MANEILYVPAFIKAIMAADGALTTAIPAARHFHRRAPQGATFPCVIYRYQDGGAGTTQNKRRLIAEVVYQIFVASVSTVDSASRTAVNRIEALFGEDNLRRTAFTAPAPDSTVLTFNTYLDDLGYISRELEGARPEETYVHTGGFYRFEVFN